MMAFTGRKYSVGTLHYGFTGMLLVCFWLLLGGFVYNIVGWVLVPALVPLMLDRCGAGSRTIALVVSSIPAAVTMVAAPIISTASDRTRSRFGRRPYLLPAAPVIAGLLVLIGWAPELGQWLAGFLSGSDSGGEFWALVLLIAGTLLFSFCNLFIGTVYYYLYPDVVPHEVMGRFLAVGNMVTAGSTAAFHFFLMRYAGSHARWVFTGLAGVFLVIFLLMCLMIREGEYPEVKNVAETSSGSVAQRLSGWIGMYFKECMGSLFFLSFFLGTGLTQVSTSCRNLFNMLFVLKELGVNEAQYGKVMGAGAIVGIITVLLTGLLIDRIEPLLIFIGTGVLVIALNVLGYFYMYDFKSFYIVGILMTTVYAAQGISISVCFVKLFPAEKYGQFCSANSMVNCLMMIVGSYLGGETVNHLGYRSIFIWDFVFTLVATAFLLYVYRKYRQIVRREGQYALPLRHSEIKRGIS